MPGIVNTPKIMEQLALILTDLENQKNWPAFEKIKLLVDSLVAFSCKNSDGTPIQSPENALNLYTELEDLEERNQKVSKDRIQRKLNLALLIKDLEKIRYQMEQNQNAYEKIKKIHEDMNNRYNNANADSRYDDFGVSGDLILEARTEAKKLSQTIITQTFAGEFVQTNQCRDLIEKYIDKAYDVGYREAKQQTIQTEVSL